MNADLIKRGTRFVHAYWLDADGAPLRCVVTRKAQGVIYYRPEGWRKGTAHFSVDARDAYGRDWTNAAITEGEGA